MKTLRHILILLGTLTSCACLSSCTSDNGDMIYDLAGVGVEIKLVDAEGNNLLSPDTEGNWLGEDMFASCDDKTYPVSWEYILYDDEHESRMYLPQFYGLACFPERKWDGTAWTPVKNDNYLLFGEFSGHGDQHKIIVFSIEKLNTVWKIELDYTLTWVKGEPNTKRSLKLNGKAVEKGPITIALPRNTK